MKAGCGKTARPVWAADGGEPLRWGTSSDPTATKAGRPTGAKGWRHPAKGKGQPRKREEPASKAKPYACDWMIGAV